MIEFDEVESDVLKVLEIVKKYKSFEIITYDDDGDGYVEINGNHFDFDKDKVVQSITIPL